MTAFFHAMKEALSELWQDLLDGEGLWKPVGRVVFFLFLLGAVRSAQVFHGMIAQMSPPEGAVPLSSESLEAERIRLDQLAGRFRLAVAARAGSGQLARMAALNGRKPYGPVTARAPSNSPALSPAKVPPPLIIVSAVMEMEGKKIAVAEIEGMGQGLLVAPGFRLTGGRGTILSVAPDRVVLIWEGDRYEIPVGY
ncbi:hypothetical protein [Aminirod propionatiphilus]|uniref:Uncharacterized protein n=1 Tax=Aminirod propionatiphilus TaxID=3415223 RepID=A0ACD1DSF9_9BACT|nr:hypothetical protein KIH16_07390 [Synergistota bacterium]